METGLMILSVLFALNSLVIGILVNRVIDNEKFTLEEILKLKEEIKNLKSE